MNTKRNGHVNGVATVSALQIENWILLNEIRDGRVVYSTGRGMYFITRSSRWVDGRLITPLLEQGFLQDVGETVGTYALSERGRRTWAQYTDELQSLVGRCDSCGQTAAVRPLIQPAQCSRDAKWWNLLCGACRQVFASEDLDEATMVPMLALEAV